MSKTIKQFVSAAFCVVFILTSVYSQDSGNDPMSELSPEELLELEAAEEKNAAEKEKLPAEHVHERVSG